MNVEKLHRILKEIQSEYNKNNILEKMRAVRNYLQYQVNQPQVPEHQQNLVNSIKVLYEILTNAPSNNFSPGWKQIIEEIGLNEILGITLKNKIENIFSRNQITPTVALKEINQIVSEIEEKKFAIDNAIKSFNILKISSDELQEGQCELGYTIPRIAVENKLSALNKEISELNFILNHITEAVTGQKQELEIRTISSSDYLLYVVIGLKVAYVLSYIIERIINNYKRILEIKSLRNQLKSKGVPEENTKGIEEYANTQMKEEIEKIAQEIVNQNYKGTDPHRKNELINGVIISLNKIANRIDRGFNIEIRVEPIPEPKKGEQVPEDIQRNIQMIIAIKEREKTLEFTKTSGPPILQLEESKEAGEKIDNNADK